MSLRQEKVNKFLVQEISEIIRKLKDPRLGFVTITAAKVSPDMRTASVGISFLGDDKERQEGLKIVAHAAAHIRRELLKVTKMRVVPMPEFYLDDGAINSTRVQILLRSIEHEQPESSDN